MAVKDIFFANQKNRPFGLWFVVSFGLWFEKITPASDNV